MDEQALDDSRRELEQAVRAACDRRDYEGATTLLIQRVGPNVLAFLLQRLRDPVEAGEAFSMFSEDLWRGLPQFAWRCSVRGWSFAVARHAADRCGRQLSKQRRRQVPISQAPLADVVAEVRERTLLHLRTEAKSRMHELFEQLPPDDRALLQLRLDQRLSWRELALALDYAGELPSELELTRSAAKLRKRYQIIKDRLRELVDAAGSGGER